MAGEFAFEEEPEPRGSGAGKAIGPIVMLVPLGFLILGVTLLKDFGREPAGPRATPPEVAHELDVDGWSGSFELDGDAPLLATLGPLHLDEERQAFDSAALARRRGLEEGQAFRLKLHHLGAEGSSTIPIERFEELRIADEDGEAGRLYARRPDPEPREPVDPVEVLLSPPRGELAPGQSLSLVLFGRAPGERVVLTGLPGGEPVKLLHKKLSRAWLEDALSRLDR